jgi:hypothetical protein
MFAELSHIITTQKTVQKVNRYEHRTKNNAKIMNTQTQTHKNIKYKNKTNVCLTLTHHHRNQV